MQVRTENDNYIVRFGGTNKPKKVAYELGYENGGFELLVRSILWVIGSMTVILIPWVINDQINYFAKGFRLLTEEKQS